MAVGGHFKSDLWVLMANNLEHVQTYSILTFSQQLMCHFPIWHTRFCGWRFSCKDPLVSVHWEYRGNFLGVYFKVSTINPFLGSNFRTNEFKWSKYRRQCWYSLSWCDSSFLACSPLHFRSRTMGARLFSQLIAEREALHISYLVWYLTNFWKYLNEDSFVVLTFIFISRF